MKLADYIRKEIKEKYKSNLEFADTCNVDEKTIRRILKAEQNISIRLLKNIADALGIKLSEILKDIDE